MVSGTKRNFSGWKMLTFFKKNRFLPLTYIMNESSLKSKKMNLPLKHHNTKLCNLAPKGLNTYTLIFNRFCVFVPACGRQAFVAKTEF